MKYLLHMIDVINNLTDINEQNNNNNNNPTINNITNNIVYIYIIRKYVILLGLYHFLQFFCLFCICFCLQNVCPTQQSFLEQI